MHVRKMVPCMSSFSTAATRVSSSDRLRAEDAYLKGTGVGARAKARARAGEGEGEGAGAGQGEGAPAGRSAVEAPEAMESK